MPKIQRKSYFKILFILIFTTYLASCAVQSTKPQKPEITLSQDDVSTINSLIQKANSAKEPKRSQYWLEIGKILTQAKDYEQSILAFKKIDANYLSANQLWLMLDYASESALALDDAWLALDFIEEISPSIKNLNSEQQKILQLRKAIAYEKVSKFEASVRAYYYASVFEKNPDAKLKIEESLWKNLVHIPKQTIEKLIRTERNANLKGWFELALIRQEATLSLPELRSKLNAWLVRWKNHPAAKNLPYDLELLRKLSENPIENFAFFLPFEGNYASSANAIRDGFLSVYYSKPAQKRNKIKINFYDTTKSSISSLYKQAKADGAQVVIGPLQKDLVDEVADYSNLPLPTLALNYGTGKVYADNLIEYGLSAEDEARQAARYAWQNGLRKALIMVVADSWGQRVRQAFTEEWLALGGKIADTSLVSKNANISSSIENLLEVNSSKKRRSQVTREIGVKLEFEPYYRKDADFIFLHFDHKNAKLVMPALKFLRADSLPVIATSAVYQIPTGAQSDLDGIIFCDLPWYLDGNDGLKQQISTLWKDRFSYFGRLYAMGIDSFKLAELLPLLHAISETNIQGVTGTLSQKDSKIFRSLPWAKFVNGYSQLINTENLKRKVESSQTQ